MPQVPTYIRQDTWKDANGKVLQKISENDLQWLLDCINKLKTTYKDTKSFFSKNKHKSDIDVLIEKAAKINENCKTSISKATDFGTALKTRNEAFELIVDLVEEEFKKFFADVKHADYKNDYTKIRDKEGSDFQKMLGASLAAAYKTFPLIKSNLDKISSATLTLSRAQVSNTFSPGAYPQQASYQLPPIGPRLDSNTQLLAEEKEINTRVARVLSDRNQAQSENKEQKQSWDAGAMKLINDLKAGLENVNKSNLKDSQGKKLSTRMQKESLAIIQIKKIINLTDKMSPSERLKLIRDTLKDPREKPAIPSRIIRDYPLSSLMKKQMQLIEQHIKKEPRAQAELSVKKEQ